MFVQNSLMNTSIVAPGPGNRNLLNEYPSQSMLTYRISENTQHEGGDKSTHEVPTGEQVASYDYNRLRSELTNLENAYTLLRREKEQVQRDLSDTQHKLRSTLDDLGMRDTKASTMEREINLLQRDKTVMAEELHRARTATSDVEAQMHMIKQDLVARTTDLESYKTQVQNLHYMTQENQRLKGLEVDLARTKQHLADDEDVIKRLNDKVGRLEDQLSQRNIELSMKDDAIRQIDVDVREMQAIIETF